MILPISLLALVAGALCRSVETPDPYVTYRDDAIIVEAAPDSRNGRQIFLDPAGPFFFVLPMPSEEPASLLVKQASNSQSVTKPPENPCWNEDGKFGRSMSPDECYPYLSTFNKTVIREAIMQTNGRYAYFDRQRGKAETGVCCTDKNVTMPFFSPVRISMGSQPAAADKPDSLQNRFEQLNRQGFVTCGIQSTGGKIVGGEKAEPGEWPWMAALMNGEKQFCGGSLIDDVHVLTAAHCVAHMTSFDVARLTIRLNEYNLKVKDEGLNTLYLRARRVSRHRDFNGKTLYNDVAIITLEKPVTFGPGIIPVCMPNPSDTRSFTGSVATVTGWGSLRDGGRQPDVLMKVNVTVQSFEECSRNYGSDAPGGITKEMICAADPGRDSCSGDSGGPMVLQQKGQWVQVGIVSWGIGCGQPPYPGVYARVTSYMPWILRNLN